MITIELVKNAEKIWKEMHEIIDIENNQASFFFFNFSVFSTFPIMGLHGLHFSFWRGNSVFPPLQNKNKLQKL